MYDQFRFILPHYRGVAFVPEAGAGGEAVEWAPRIARWAAAVEARYGPEKRPCPSSRPKACEVRRVGDKKWRRFASRADAARAFRGINARDISRLINNSPHVSKSVRERYEARSVGGESRSAPVSAARGARDSGSDDEEDVSGRAPSRSGNLRGNPQACEVRRVGDKKWRRFASRTDAAVAFPDLRDTRTVSRLITDNPGNRAPEDIRKRFEARNVPRRPRSPPVSAAVLAAAARGPLTELHAAGLGALASPAGAAGAVAAATAAVKWLGAAGGG